MKTLSHLLRPLSKIALAAGIASAVGLAAPVTSFAQDRGAQAEQSAQGAAHRGRRGRHGRGMRGRLMRLGEELHLTDAQRAQIRQIHQSARERVQALRAQGADRGAMSAIRQETRAQVRALLTPAQRQQAQELRAQQAQRIQDRRLSHMTERLGLSATQQQQVRGILRSGAQQRRALMEQARLDGNPPREAMQALRGRTQAQLRSVLNAEQQAQLQQMRASRGERGRHGRGAARGAPAQGGPAR